jgi:hypothetical protein
MNDTIWANGSRISQRTAAASWCLRSTALSCAQTVVVVRVRSRGISVKPEDTS